MNKFFIFYFLFFLSFLNEFEAQSENDNITSKTIFVTESITAAELANVASVIANIPEVTSAVYVSGLHHCMIFDINTGLGNDINFYSDLIKRLNNSYDPKKIRIKTPNAYNEIIQNSLVGDINTLK